MNIAKLLFVFALTIHFSHSNAEFKQEETFSLTRSDHSIITYYLQKPNKLREKIPLLLVLQGSQFESVFDHDASKQKMVKLNK